MTHTLMTEQEIQDQVFNKFEKYNSFINAKGIRRAKAVEWAIVELKSNKSELGLDFKEETLLQKVGWNTFIGLSLYISLPALLDKIQNQEIKKLSHTLKLLIKDILELTDIGNVISLGVSIEATDQLKFARVDNAGNIFIFPVDTEDLLFEIEETL
jgi:hypothetical protein